MGDRGQNPRCIIKNSPFVCKGFEQLKQVAQTAVKTAFNIHGWNVVATEPHAQRHPVYGEFRARERNIKKFNELVL